jgi:hypothetical protein
MSLLDKGYDPEPYMRREAEFSEPGEDGVRPYRYCLLRCWDPQWDERADAAMYFVMLNPSTADHEVDDPTIRRCIGFAKACGFKALYVVNLYALRATNPKDLWESSDPAGRMNLAYLEAICLRSVNIGGVIVAGWGNNALPVAVEEFRALVEETGASIWCLGANANGSPKHPLYIPADRALDRWA